jgi:hypothetical protein
MINTAVSVGTKWDWRCHFFHWQSIQPKGKPRLFIDALFILLWDMRFSRWLKSILRSAGFWHRLVWWALTDFFRKTSQHFTSKRLYLPPLLHNKKHHNNVLPYFDLFNNIFDISVRCSGSLRAGRSGYRIPVRARFSAPVQTGPGAHPATCTMGTVSLSRG